MTYRDNPLIAAKYKSKRWKRLRKEKLLLTNGLCERCLKNGLSVPAYFVHHKEYVTDKNYEDDNVFFNIDNTESLCKKCHNQEHFSEEEEYCFDENGDFIKNESLYKRR